MYSVESGRNVGGGGAIKSAFRPKSLLLTSRADGASFIPIYSIFFVEQMGLAHIPKRHKTPTVGRQSKQDHLDFIGLDMFAHKRVFASF